MMKSDVSVIIPTYNRARFVSEAVTSVLAQRNVEFELVIINDGSTDNTKEILDCFSDDYRIRVLDQPNRGQANARSRGVEQTDSPFVCFLDSDNRWRPEKLCRQLELMAECPEYGVIYGDNEIIDEEGKARGPMKMQRHSGWITRPLLKDNFVNFNSAMIRREYLDRVGGPDGALRVADDYDLWLRLSVVCQFLYKPEVWCDYRVMSDQISSDKEGRFSANRQILEQFLVQNADDLDAETIVQTWISFYVRRARWGASLGRRAQAFQDLRHALGYRFFDRTIWRAMARAVIGGN